MTSGKDQKIEKIKPIFTIFIFCAVNSKGVEMLRWIFLKIFGGFELQNPKH